MRLLGWLAASMVAFAAAVVTLLPEALMDCFRGPF
jgi:hypothetical protein